MRRSLLIPLFLLMYLSAMAQPASYVAGTQVCWNFNGRDHGYFKAAGNGERHILISFTGDGETNCSNYQGQSPQKWLNDAGLNWDGRTVRAPGDTVVWEVLTIPNTSGTFMGAYAADINYFFAHIAAIDTADHSKFHIEGLSGGVGRQWGFMGNLQGHNSPYRNIFSTTISQSGAWLGNFPEVSAYSYGRRHWVWYGTADANAGTPPAASVALYNALNGHKYLTAQVGSGHGASTWDSCMSLKGTDTLTNRWLWMVTTQASTPPPCYPGGPAGYVPGTQVNWQFNGRSHGYFRAAGCGERHILVNFAGDAVTDSTNYQNESPQKLLNDLGINWNGRTVRAPGDTIVWEVLTIHYNSGYWLPNYASDINYFFANIAPVDTTDHDLFHISGISGGVGRMWGFLVNDQSHNSPYRSVFSTTITVAAPWFSNTTYTNISANSSGRRHWVWHGADDVVNSPSAGANLYNVLNGDKRFTLQAGAGHSAVTVDSAFSLIGTDSSNNRWLWMVTPPASLLRMAPPAAQVVKTLEQPAGLLAYPNPAASTARLSWAGKAGIVYRVSMMDLSGRLRRSESGIRGSTYTVDVSGLDRGLYIVKVEGGGEQFVLKLVKE